MSDVATEAPVEPEMTEQEIADMWEALNLSLDDTGCLIDPETGDVIDPAAPPSMNLPPSLAPLLDPFQVNTRDDANHALEIRFDLEGAIQACDDRIAAYTANVTAIKRRFESRLKWWDFRWSGKLIEWAKTSLWSKGRPFGSGKTCRLDFGKISFRDSGETIEIIDDEAAVAWAEKWAPEIVKVKKHVNKTDIMKVRESLRADGVDQTLLFAQDIPRKENVPSIKTGV